MTPSDPNAFETLPYLDSTIEEPRPNPEEDLIKREDLMTDCRYKAWMGLNDNERELLCLRLVDNASRWEIAEILGISPKSVGTTIGRAKKKVVRLRNECRDEDRTEEVGE